MLGRSAVELYLSTGNAWKFSSRPKRVALGVSRASLKLGDGINIFSRPINVVLMASTHVSHEMVNFSPPLDVDCTRRVSPAACIAAPRVEILVNPFSA